MKNLNPSYIGLRNDLISFIQGDNNLILDVGCATGTNGEFLLKNKIASQIYGIEYDSEMAAVASKRNTKVFQGDLNDSSFIEHILLSSPLFDYILFADILEHLNDPEIVLSKLIKNLKPNGKVIISLPNIAHIETFIQIYIKGTWPKNPRGIFDKTHLRWFTKKDAFLMVERCGLKMIKYERKLRARDALGSKFNWKYNLIKFWNKDLVTFQHLLVCSNGE